MHLGDNHSKLTKMLCCEDKKNPKQLENYFRLGFTKKLDTISCMWSFTPTTSSNLNVEWPSKPKRLDEILIYKVWPQSMTVQRLKVNAVHVGRA